MRRIGPDEADEKRPVAAVAAGSYPAHAPYSHSGGRGSGASLCASQGSRFLLQLIKASQGPVRGFCASETEHQGVPERELEASATAFFA